MSPDDVYAIKWILGVSGSAIVVLLASFGWSMRRHFSQSDATMARFDGKLDGIGKTTAQHSVDIVELKVNQGFINKEIGRLGVLYDDIAGFLSKDMGFKKRGS